MNNTIHVTSESKKLIIAKLHEASLHEYDVLTKEILKNIAFNIVLIKRYNKIPPILQLTYLPRDLLNIIIDYINDVIDLKGIIFRHSSHILTFHIKTNKTVINFEKYRFGATLFVDIGSILHNIFKHEVDINSYQIREVFNDIDFNKYCVNNNGFCDHTNLYNKLHMTKSDSILCISRDINCIDIFNRYMEKHYNKNTYIDIPCNKEPVLPKIHNHKKMKNMIVIVKLLLYTFIGK